VAKQPFRRPGITLGPGIAGVVHGLIVACLRSSREPATRGLPGALGLPLWVIGVLVLAAGACFVATACRQLRPKRDVDRTLAAVAVPRTIPHRDSSGSQSPYPPR